MPYAELPSGTGNKFEELIPQGWEALQLFSICARRVAGTMLRHPSLVFTNEDSSQWELLEDKLIVATNTYCLEKEIGSEVMRLGMADELANVREKYSLPQTMPAKEMRKKF